VQDMLLLSTKVPILIPEITGTKVPILTPEELCAGYASTRQLKRTCGCRRVHYYIYTYIFTTIYTHIGRVVAGAFTIIYTHIYSLLYIHI
jgi:hypothetical protein